MKKLKREDDKKNTFTTQKNFFFTKSRARKIEQQKEYGGMRRLDFNSIEVY